MSGAKVKGSTRRPGRSALLGVALGACFAVGAGCGDGAVPPAETPASQKGAPVNTASMMARAGQPGASDPVGPKPTLAAPKVFEPPSPTVAKAPNGLAVWVVERATLPLVSVTLTIPSGSGADPIGKAGLAHITADMLDEGAGTRSAVELSSAISDLGATVSIGVTADGSYATLTVLKKNFAPAFGLLSDIVARPRLDAKEWKRVSDLWRNALRKRADDPSAVSRVASGAALYGLDHPYGHPPEGLLRGADAIDLGAVKAFYKAQWRPDQATLVVAGDVTKDEMMQAVTSSLGGWKAPAGAAKAAVPPAFPEKRAAPRLVLVDRPDAPQSVIAVVREGVAASDPKAPQLDLINMAIGGSFTSRLNQSLREDHGWSYGARSVFTEARGRGAFIARAAVHTDATGPALKEMLTILSKVSTSGLTEEELVKVRAQDRGDLVQQYESVSGISRRLATLAMLGLPTTFDADASRARQQATLAGLSELAAAVSPQRGTVVVVGPKVQVMPQLAALGLGDPELWDAEGAPVGAAPAAKDAKKGK